MHPKDVLRHHVTGAIERGEAEAIVEQRAMTLAEWLKRYGATLHESPAGYRMRVFAEGLSSEAIWDLYHLSDYVVSALISGPAFSLSPR